MEKCLRTMQNNVHIHTEDNAAADVDTDDADDDNIVVNVIVQGEKENLFRSSYFVSVFSFSLFSLIEKRKIPSSIQFEYMR